MADDEFVESGSFRVDREKALTKLAKYQLADPWDFAAAWARLAVESGAQKAEVSNEEGASLLRFDGRTLPGGLLLDPVSALFNEDPDGRGRLLAVGLLALQKLGPASVELRSGGRIWQQGPVGGRTERASEEPGTRVRIVWEIAKAPEAGARFIQEFKAVLALANLEVVIEGLSLGRRHAEAQDGVRKRDSMGRRVCARKGGSVYAGTVSVYHRGVRVFMAAEPALAGMEVHVQDDELPLDFTGCRSTWDRRMGDTFKLAEETAFALFPRAPSPRRPQLRISKYRAFDVAMLLICAAVFACFSWDFAASVSAGPDRSLDLLVATGCLGVSLFSAFGAVIAARSD